MCYGLRTDFQGKLLQDQQNCWPLLTSCGNSNNLSLRAKSQMVIRQSQDGTTVTDGAQIEIGGNDKYVSLCRKHWKEATAYEHAK